MSRVCSETGDSYIQCIIHESSFSFVYGVNIFQSSTGLVLVNKS